MCRHSVRKLPFLIRNNRDQYIGLNKCVINPFRKMVEHQNLSLTATKIKKACNKAVDNYPQALRFVPNCYIIQKIYEGAVNTHPSIIQFVPECYEAQETCNKDSIPNQYKTQEICEIVVSLYPFLILYCTDKYETQKMCDEAVDNCLAAGLLQVKCLKDLIIIYMLIMIYYFIMIILINSC